MKNHILDEKQILFTRFICIDCYKPLANETPNRLFCNNCLRTYKLTKEGVWDFSNPVDAKKPLDIYQESEYGRWLEIFGKIESKNWKIYETKFKRFFSQAGHRKLGKLLKVSGAKNKSVLEIGSGAGELLNHVELSNYTAIDTNWNALVILKEKYPEVNAIFTSGGRLPFDDETFEIIVSLHALEHVYYIGELLEEIIRILKINGTNHFVIPTEGGLPFLLGRKLITGPHLRKKYELDVQYVMDREHINDAPRVLKFLRMYFSKMNYRYWPFPFLPFLNANAMILGTCIRPNKKR